MKNDLESHRSYRRRPFGTCEASALVWLVLLFLVGAGWAFYSQPWRALLVTAVALVLGLTTWALCVLLDWL